MVSLFLFFGLGGGYGADEVTAGSPGADRVVFTASGQRAGEITHTGASGNNFVACSGW